MEDLDGDEQFLRRVLLEIRPGQLHLKPFCGIEVCANFTDNDAHEACQRIPPIHVRTPAGQLVIQHASVPHGPLKATEQRPVCAVVRNRDTTARGLFDERKTITSCSEARPYALPMIECKRVSEKQVTFC